MYSENISLEKALNRKFQSVYTPNPIMRANLRVGQTWVCGAHQRQGNSAISITLLMSFSVRVVDNAEDFRRYVTRWIERQRHKFI